MNSETDGQGGSKMHSRTTFQIPEEARALIRAWQESLPASPGLHWSARYKYTFVDNGLVDKITVTDALTGKEFNWAPPLESW